MSLFRPLPHRLPRVMSFPKTSVETSVPRSPFLPSDTSDLSDSSDLSDLSLFRPLPNSHAIAIAPFPRDVLPKNLGRNLGSKVVPTVAPTALLLPSDPSDSSDSSDPSLFRPLPNSPAIAIAPFPRDVLPKNLGRNLGSKVVPTVAPTALLLPSDPSDSSDSSDLSLFRPLPNSPAIAIAPFPRDVLPKNLGRNLGPSTKTSVQVPAVVYAFMPSCHIPPPPAIPEKTFFHSHSICYI